MAEQPVYDFEQLVRDEESAARTTSQKIAFYYRFNKVKCVIENLLKPINADLKAKMIAAKCDKKVAGDYELILGTQDKSKVDNDKLVALLKEKKLTKAIKKIEMPDEAMVEKLVNEGKITPEEFKECVVENVVTTLKIQEVKK